MGDGGRREGGRRQAHSQGGGSICQVRGTNGIIQMKFFGWELEIREHVCNYVQNRLSAQNPRRGENSTTWIRANQEFE